MYNGSQDREASQQGSQKPHTTQGQPSFGQFKAPGSAPLQMDQGQDAHQFTANQGYPGTQATSGQLSQPGYFQGTQASQQGYYQGTQASAGQVSQPGYFQGAQPPAGQVSQSGYYQGTQAPQQGYYQGTQAIAGQFSQQGHLIDGTPGAQAASGQGAYQFTANQGYTQGQMGPRFVYDGPSSDDVTYSRTPRGFFDRLDRSAQVGLFSGVAVLLVIAIVGVVMLSSANSPAKQTAQTLVATATLVPTATATPEPTATPTPMPTATPVPTATPIPVAHYNPVPTATPKPMPTATPKPVVTPTVTPNATATAAATCPPVPAAHVNDVEPAPPNPWCYDFDSFATVANEILNPPANFCSVMTVNMSNGNFHCNANFAQQTGFVVLCHDDAWARAPHHADADTACKDDGGYEKDLYQHN